MMFAGECGSGLSGSKNARRMVVKFNFIKNKTMFFSGVLMGLLFGQNLALAKKPVTVQVNGEYTVPVPADRPDLIPFAKFPTRYKIKYVNGIPSKISYDLPTELTGGPEDIEIAPQPSQRNIDAWNGPKSKGNCAFDGESVSCDMIYNQSGMTSLNLNQEAAFQAIDQKIENLELRKLAKEVTVLFGNETIGVLKFVIPKPNQR